MSEVRKGSLAKRPEVLLVEDDPQIRKFLKAMLTAEDYRFTRPFPVKMESLRPVPGIPT